MNIAREIYSGVRKSAEEDFTLFQLKMLIILWALFVVCVVVFVNNKWLLAAILAYEVLP